MAHSLPSVEEIDLRWTLRDIHARRFKLMRLSAEELQHLVDQGFVEMRDLVPELTDAGLAKIER